MSRSGSDDTPRPAFPEVPQQQITCQVQGLLEDVLTGVLSREDMESRFALNQPNALAFAIRILRYLFGEAYILQEDVEREALSFFKMFLLKRGFNGFEEVVAELCTLLAPRLDRSIDNEPLVSCAINFLGVLSNWNSGSKPQRNLLLNNRMGSFKATFDHDAETTKFCLNRDFTAVLGFRVDAVQLRSENRVATLFSYTNEYTDHGYSLYLQNDTLWFRYLLPVKGPEMLTEFKVIERVADLIGNDWACLIFQCQYNSGQKTCSLRFQLNNKVYLTAKAFEDVFCRSIRQTFLVLNNCFAEFSLLAVANRALSADKMQSIQSLLTGRGMTTPEALDMFAKSTSDVIEAEGFWVFLHPFCHTHWEAGEWTIRDWFGDKAWSLGSAQPVWEVSGRHLRNGILRIRYFEAVLVLMHFAKTEDDFASLLRVLKSFFANAELQTAIEERPRRFCRQLVATLVVTKKGPHFSRKAVEAIFYAIRSQSERVMPVFCRRLLFEFAFLDKTLASDAVVSAYFEEVTRLFNGNLNLFRGLDFNQLFQAALLFLDQPAPLAHLKAFCILKLISQAVRLPDCATRFALELPLRYFFCAVANQSLINITVLKIVRLTVKHASVPRDKQKLFCSSLVAMLHKTDDGILLSKVFKLLMGSELKAEPVLLSLWRRKALGDRASEKTKKLFWVYQNSPTRVKNIDKLVHLLFRRCFSGAPKNQPAADWRPQPESATYLNLLLEVSLSGDLSLINLLVLAFNGMLQNKDSNFADFAGRSWLLHWLVAVLFRLANQPEETDLTELAMDLLYGFCLARYRQTGQLEWLNTLSELVSFFTLETKNERLKFTLINTVLATLNRESVIFENKFLVACFLVFSFKYYFALLSDSPGDDGYVTFAREFSALVHRSVNLNPLPSLPLDLTDDITGLFEDRSKLMSSLRDSTAFLTGGTDAFKEGYVCPLKLLVLTFLDILDGLLVRRETKPKTDFAFEFVNAFVYRLNYFLENHRKKMKADRTQLLEALVFQVVTLSLRTPGVFPHIRELVEAMFYFVGKPGTDPNVNTKMLKELRVDYYVRPGEFYHSLKFENVPREVVLAEFALPDFAGSRKDFLLMAYGRINDAMASSDFAGSDDLFADGQRSDFKEYMDTEAGAAKYSQLLNEVFFAELKRGCRFNYVFRGLLKRHFSRDGAFFNRDSAANVALRFQFDPKEFEYDAKKAKIVQFRTVPFVSRGGKQPFMAPKYRNSRQQVTYPKEPALPTGFSMSDYARRKGNTHYFCDRVDGLRMVPSVLVLNQQMHTLWILVNVEADADSLTSKFGCELKIYERRSWHKISRKVPAARLRNAYLFKFLNQRNAVLLQLTDFAQILLHFASETEASSAMAILQAFAGRSPDDVYGGASGVPKNSSPQGLVDDWMAHKVSNFDFLMQVNLFGSRTWADYSQYPVMPLLTKKHDTLMTLRDLEKPVGMNCDEKCVAAHQRTFDASNPPDDKGFFYGSHYSYPAHVFNLLVRRYPETEGSKAVHNNAYDFPDRIFFSVQVMLRNVMEDPADVRELLPEFFYLPEIFLNINNYDFGVGQNGQRVHNVQMPETVRGNPYIFVSTLRQLLESPIVSLKLGSWVDLIFGFKQHGSKAVEAKNVFFPITYEQNFRSLNMEGDEHNRAKMNQIYNFGQIPGRLYARAVPNRRVTAEQQTLASVDAKIKYFLRFRDANIVALNPLFFVKKITENSIMESKTTKRLAMVRQKSVEVWRFRLIANTRNNLNPYEMFQESVHLIPKIRTAYLLAGGSVRHQDTVDLTLDYRMVQGGLCGGVVLIASFRIDKVLARKNLHEQMVVKLQFVSAVNLLSADAVGIIKLSSFDSKASKITPLVTCVDFSPHPIRGLSICRDDKRLLCIDTITTIEIRSLDRMENVLFVMQKKDLPFLPSNAKEPITTAAFLSLNYVSCVVLFAYFGGHNHLYSFSLLGQLLGHYTHDDRNQSPFSTFSFIPDEHFRDFLMVTNRRGDVMIFDLPFFEQGKKISSNQNNVACHVSTFLKKKLAMVVDDRGFVDILSAAFVIE